MPPIADLLLTLRAAPSGLVAEATLTSPAHPPATFPAAPVAFDHTRLLALSGDAGMYGRALTAMLFADVRLRDAYMRAEGLAAGAQTALRLRLRVDPSAAACAGLRWETLHDLTTVRPLALSEQVRFARAADSADLTITPLPARPQLQALLAVASPADDRYSLPSIATGDDLARLRAALADVPTTQLPGGAARRHTTLNALIDGLRDAHVLVLVAHGRLIDGRPVVYLEDEAGRAAPVAGDDLAGRIAQLPTRPLLIVLAVCDSAGDSQGDGALHALAPLLAQTGVPAVIGAQGQLPMDLAAALLPTLLTELRRDGLVDRALAAARAALSAAHPWWMPALYLRGAESRLWQEEPPPPPPRSQEREGRLGFERMEDAQRSRARRPIPPRGEGPVFRVPYRPNPQFVGREDALADVIAALEDDSPVALTPAISGIGGIGKSQLAIQTAYRHRDAFPGGVFWLAMEQPDAIAEQVAAYAGPEELGLDLTDELDLAARVALMRRAWEGRERRLLIFDNLEEPALLDLWRPMAGGSRVLITSRNQSWGAFSGVRTLPLTPLARAESLKLLLTPRVLNLKLDWEQLRVDRDAAGAICAELGDLPLALTLAGAYLGRYPSLDLRDYVAQIRAGQAADASLNPELREGLPRDHAPSILATFDLSYEQLRRDDPIDAMAHAMLHAAACCAPEGVPRPLLLATGDAHDTPDGQRQGDSAIGRLSALGLLEADGDQVKLHRLLGAYVRSRDAMRAQSRERAARAAVTQVRQLDKQNEGDQQAIYRPHLELMIRAFEVPSSRIAMRSADPCQPASSF